MESFIDMSVIILFLPVVAYRTPGYNLDSLKASRDEVKEVPVTINLVTPMKNERDG